MGEASDTSEALKRYRRPSAKVSSVVAFRRSPSAPKRIWLAPPRASVHANISVSAAFSVSNDSTCEAPIIAARTVTSPPPMVPVRKTVKSSMSIAPSMRLSARPEADWSTYSAGFTSVSGDHAE